LTERNRPDAGREGAGENRRYTTYLIIIALAGWALASYDLNLLVLTVPDISQDLTLSESLVGSLIFFVSAAQFIVTLFVGYGMDTLGRKRMWMLCLTAAALFTGLTFVRAKLLAAGYRAHAGIRVCPIGARRLYNARK
jgi:MFS family permease